MQVNGKHYRTVIMEGSTVRMINQPLIPYRFELIDLPTFVTRSLASDAGLDPVLLDTDHLEVDPRFPAALGTAPAPAPANPLGGR